ncbi:MAG: methionyl-tRNA formyltransferase [Arenicellales bacterium]|nr:methionyl-tRNA formyltransferase [Arenicellales bacterium]
MRVVFAGTPQFAVPTLKGLIDAGIDISAVYTQPDRPAGRGRQLLASPVKRVAEDHSIPVIQPVSLREETASKVLQSFAPEVVVVAAYGLILPNHILDIPPFGCVNVHASLLPRWRGAAPIPRAIEAGDSISGITIMKMDSGLDTGPIIAKREIPIDDEDNSATLHDKLAQVGAELLVETLPVYLSGRTKAQQQDERNATYANKLSKAEARINWQRSAFDIRNQVRAFNPWPIAFTFHRGERIRILRAQIANEVGDKPAPGSICNVAKGGIDVACGDGLLSLKELQREGGKPLLAGDFINGYPVKKGEHFQ